MTDASIGTQEVWQRFGQDLRGFVAKRIADPSDAEDVLQDVFLKIHLNLDGLRDDSRLVPWLYRIARNAIIDYYRSRHASVPLPETLVDDRELVDRGAARELAAGLDDLINGLPEKYRQALLLTEIQGLSQVEMARQLGLSVSGAKSRVQRARRLLRAALFQCCHVELDARRHVMDFVPRARCCQQCGAAL